MWLKVKIYKDLNVYNWCTYTNEIELLELNDVDDMLPQNQPLLQIIDTTTYRVFLVNTELEEKSEAFDIIKKGLLEYKLNTLLKNG